MAAGPQTASRFTPASRTVAGQLADITMMAGCHPIKDGARNCSAGEDEHQLSTWAIERAMRKARSKLKGLPAGFRYHDLRHYFASLPIADGADVETVQAGLRRASAKTTIDTYGHIWPDRDESTKATVDAVLTAYLTEQRRNSATAEP